MFLHVVRRTKSLHRPSRGRETMPDIVRWDPSESFVSLRQMMDRLFEDAWVRPAMWRGTGEAQSTLAVDLYESGDDVMVTATVPGVRPDDVEITIQGNILTIKGETRVDSNVN